MTHAEALWDSVDFSFRGAPDIEDVQCNDTHDDDDDSHGEKHVCFRSQIRAVPSIDDAC